MMTVLTQSSSLGTKQEENTDCMGYFLRAMSEFLLRGRQLYFRKAQQTIIVVNIWRRKIQIAHLCGKSQTCLPEMLE